MRPHHAATTVGVFIAAMVLLVASVRLEVGMIRFWHRHRYDLRETRDNVRYLVCACGSAVPMLKRDTPVTVTPPAHETMRAQRPMRFTDIDPLEARQIVFDGIITTDQLLDMLDEADAADTKKVH